MRTLALFPAVALAALVFWPRPAPAQTAVACDGAADFPCGFQMRDVGLQPVPRTFKFQARVSQAKLPIGEGVFGRVIVNLKRGDETLCREEFRDVRVAASVVNLEIGRNMSCELDQVIAENADLFFQLCIGGPENCLRPIELGTTPYSIKSTFAAQCRQAYQSDIAGQANYAHRATADRDLFLSKELGYGYFDFETPASAPALYTDDQFRTYKDGGFLQWTPLRETDPTLNICARDPATDRPVPLSRLVLASQTTQTTGRLDVLSGGVHVTGSSEVNGNTTVRGQLKVDRPAAGPQGLVVNGPATLNGTATVTDALNVNPGGVAVTGASNFSGVVTVTDIVVDGRLRVNGEFQIPGEVNIGGVSADFSVGNDLAVGGAAAVTGGLSIGQGLAFRSESAGDGGRALVHDTGDTLVVNKDGDFAGGTRVEGDTLVQGGLNVAGNASAAALAVSGNVNAGSLTVGGVTNAFVPRGAILMWSGTRASIPAGWALCDGQNGTPNLQDRFILGLINDRDPGETGGSNFVTLTIGQMPRHSHYGITDWESNNHTHDGWTGAMNRNQWHSHGFNVDNSGGWNGSYPEGDSDRGGKLIARTFDSNVDHEHWFRTAGQSAGHRHNIPLDGNFEPFDNRPRYYMLAFIMKL